MHENRETSEMPAATVGDRTAGKGSGHAARMYVPEESHIGILPMNHSNKDGTLLAESEEGRLPIKENVLQPNTHPIAVSVGNIDFAVPPESHVRWLIEQPV